MSTKNTSTGRSASQKSGTERMSGALNRQKTGQNASSEQVPAKAPRTRPVRLTVDVDPELHRQLKHFALTEADDARLADVVRALIGTLGETEVSTAVLAELRRRTG